MNRKDILGHAILFFIGFLTFLVMIFGGVIFFIGSLIFFGLGGLFELIIMRKFYGPKARIKKKLKFSLRISRGVLWVHGIIHFIKIENNTIYDFKRFGYLTSFTSYFIMLLYVFVASLLFKVWNFYAFIIYIFPILTNLIFLLKNRYMIFAR